MVQRVPDRHAQLHGGLVHAGWTFRQHADDPQTVRVRHGFDKIEHFRFFFHFYIRLSN